VAAATSPPGKCLESDEIRRETPTHAHESLEKKISRTSQGLALEQFLILREEEIRAGSHRSHALTQSLRAMSKAPPFKMQRTGHPKFNYKARLWFCRGRSGSIGPGTAPVLSWRTQSPGRTIQKLPVRHNSPNRLYKGISQPWTFGAKIFDSMRSTITGAPGSLLHFAANLGTQFFPRVRMP
jgi:hypothetical protein